MADCYVLNMHKKHDVWLYTVVRDGLVLVHGNVMRPEDAVEVLRNEVRDDELVAHRPVPTP